MIKVKTKLNQIITFEEKDGELVASMELQLEPIKLSCYPEMVDIMQVLKLDNIPDSVRETLEEKLEDHKDSLMNELGSYCEENIDVYCELIKD